MVEFVVLIVIGVTPVELETRQQVFIILPNHLALVLVEAVTDIAKIF